MTEITQTSDITKATPCNILYIEDYKPLAESWKMLIDDKFPDKVKIIHTITHSTIDQMLSENKIKFEDIDLIFTTSVGAELEMVSGKIKGYLENGSGPDWLDSMKDKVKLPPVIILSMDSLKGYADKNGFIYMDKMNNADDNMEKIFSEINKLLEEKGQAK